MTTTEERVAVARRLREMLLRQREMFQRYLDLLVQEESSIESGDAEKLQSQLELERGVIAEIHTLRKVIDPLEELYQAAYPHSEESVPPLRATLEKMGGRIKERNTRNRAALEEKMIKLRLEIAGLRARPRPRSPYAEVVPSLVDITT